MRVIRASTFDRRAGSNIRRQARGWSQLSPHKSAHLVSGGTEDELVAQYGEENGKFLFAQFNAYRKHYSGLTYISTGVESDDASRNQARAEATKEGWTFDEVKGDISLLERLVNGEWDAKSFLVVPPGATIRATLGEGIVDAE